MSLIKTQKGSALLITLVIVSMVFGLMMLAINNSMTETKLTSNQIHSDDAFYLAQAGIEKATAALDANSAWRAGYANAPFEGGTFTVRVADSATVAALKDTLRFQSTGAYGDSKRTVEVLLVQDKFHPLYKHAIYAGNYTQYDSTKSPQTYTANMNFGGTGTSADQITGDIHFNGNMNFSGNSKLTGNATAGGTITGNSPTGTKTPNAEYIEPPNLTAMNYQTTSDYFINSSSPFNASGQLPSTDPRHIFVKNFRTDLATTFGYKFDNTNYFFGDPYDGKSIANVSVSAAGNQKVYYIDGNLWVEPDGSTSQLLKGPADGTQITVVVRGNIYFCDDLLYNDKTKDGIAFIAMTDGESYNDANGNGKFDAGETILHDNGNGVYDGPSEGSGNIRFGDPNGGGLGNINSYLYAENNFEDYVLSGPKGSPMNFSVNGMLSAGNQMNIKRDYTGGHSKMAVTYDNRLLDGTLTLPGLPKRKAGGTDLWMRVAWKEL